MIGSYPMATDDERSEIEHLIGNFKPMDKASDAVYHTVHNVMFGGS